MKEHIIKTVNSGLFVLLDSMLNREWQIVRNFCLDPDPELGKFKAGSGSGINSFGSTTLVKTINRYILINKKKKKNILASEFLQSAAP